MTSPDPDWQRWYDAHAARLLLYARQWLPERADAEDDHRLPIERKAEA